MKTPLEKSTCTPLASPRNKVEDADWKHLWLAQENTPAWTELPASTSLAPSQLSTKVKVITAKESVHTWRNSQLGPHFALNRVKSAITPVHTQRQQTKSCLELWPNSQNHPSAGPAPCQVLVQPPSTPDSGTTLHWGEGVFAQESALWSGLAFKQG